MEESFSIRWDEEESEEVTIGIPVRPQPGILRIIGSVLVIGGLLALLSGVSNIWTGMDDGPTDPVMYEPVALQLQAAGEDVTSEEIAAYYDAIAEKGYYSVLGTLETCAGILLFVSGILLFRCHSYGIRIGLAGGSLLLLDAVAGLYFLRSVEAPSAMLSLTLNILQILVTACGLFCTALPLLPLVLSGAREALDPNRNAPSLLVSEESE